MITSKYHIRVGNWKKVHSAEHVYENMFYTECGLWGFLSDAEETIEPITCKNCLKGSK